MKLLLLWLQDTMGSVEGSSTISYVFAMKGGNELELDGASSILNWVRNNHKHLKFGPLTRNWTYKAFRLLSSSQLLSSSNLSETFDN